MRGAGDQLSIGERIAFYRRRRGLSQAVLADLVGRSEDWLSKIKRGERDIRRLDVLADVARGLRVTLGDLLGEPVLMEDQDKNDDVPATRDALMAPRRLSRTLFADRDDSMHAMRHLFASSMLERGVTIKELAAYLGHADEGFTLRTYTHLMPSSHHRARAAVDDIFKPRSKPRNTEDTA